MIRAAQTGARALPDDDHDQHVQVRAESSNGNGASPSGSQEYDYDLFTIGAGSGGTRASRLSASTYGLPLPLYNVRHTTFAYRKALPLVIPWDSLTSLTSGVKLGT